MVSRARRIHVARDVKRRAKLPPADQPQTCLTPGCGKPTQRTIGKGLSATHCKACVEHRRRHGSYWRRSYLVRELRPFREAARQWLRDNAGDGDVEGAITALDSMLASSGRPQSAFAIRGLPSRERSRIALARLYAAGKDGRTLLLIVLTIRATMSAIGPHGSEEFLQVQVAKMAHRLASGTVMRDADGNPLSLDRSSPHRAAVPRGYPRFQVSKWPRAEGAVMRHLGAAILERTSRVATAETIAEIVSMANAGGPR